MALNCVFQPNYLEFYQFTLCFSIAGINVFFVSVKACSEAGDLVAQTYILEMRTTTWFMSFLFSLNYTGRDYTARNDQVAKDALSFHCSDSTGS